jgi:hypothetical protein
MPHELRQSQTYRERARECRHLAEIASRECWKLRYLQLAKVYDTLADQAEAKEKRGTLAGTDW